MAGPAGAAPDEANYILDLAGERPASGHRAPPGLSAAADAAAETLRSRFPDWLWSWVQENGVLDLRTYAGPISWWWYTPLTEMSPIRSPLFRQVYWLLLVRAVVREHGIRRVRWIGGDPLLARAAAEMLAAMGVEFEARSTAALPSRWRDAARRVAFAFHQVACGVCLRAFGFGRVGVRGADVALFSRFPVLWEFAAGEATERMFGEWPKTLAARGHVVAFVAAYSGSLAALFKNRRRLLAACEANRIVLLEAVAPLSASLVAHLDVKLWWRYARWRRAARAVRFEDIDITGIFMREFDTSALATELPFDRVIDAGLRALLAREPGVRSVHIPFEYQPMERAVAMASAASGRVVVGLQTGLYTSNQMGFTFPGAQVRDTPDDARRAPLPDVLAAYGDLPGRVFSARLGERRVLRPGPIRYAHLARPPLTDRSTFLAREGLAPGTKLLLATTPSVRHEAETIIRAAFEVAAGRSGVFLALKFHYHRPMHREVAAAASRFPDVRYRVFESHLDDLLAASSAMICGGSSTAIEAMSRGCMPLVLHSVGDLSPSAVLEVRDAAFFWETTAELAALVSAVLEGHPSAEARRARWAHAIQEHLSPLSGDMCARLYALLRERRVFGTAVAESL